MAEKDWIRTYFAPLAKSNGALGLSDDLAELNASSRTVITTDAIVEGVHFFASDPIESVARKLVRVNVSDILASGSIPAEALLTLGWPISRSEADLKVFADAFGQELDRWNISLVGGDTVSVPSGLFLSLTLTGVPAGEKIVRRIGAAIGDDIWISGEIGWGGLGLMAARAGSEHDDAINYYREPKLPPLNIASCVAKYASASIDVSDGLLIDLKTLLDASTVGGELTLEAIPFPNRIDSVDEMLHALTAGDDYQVLFTAPKNHRAKISESGLNVSIIGDVTAGPSKILVFLRGSIVNLPETLGYEHS